MAESKDNAKLVTAGLIGLGVVIIVGVTLLGRRPEEATQPVTKAGPTGPQVEGAPDTSKPVELPVPDSIDRVPAFAFDVYDPPKVFAAIRGNEWLSATSKAPLGQGFLGSWAGFLGSQGEDLGASFAGTVVNHLASALLDKPFRVVWLAGEASSGTPIIVLPSPSKAALGAYAALDESIRRGTYTGARCPGEGGEAFSIQVGRWLAADRAVYATKLDSPLTILLGRTPSHVYEAACLIHAKTPGLSIGPRTPGSDLEVEISTEVLGRAPQALTAFVGLNRSPRLALGVEGTKFVSKGIGGELQGTPRLGAAALPPGLLQVLPKEVPVALLLELLPPAELHASALSGWLKGESDGRAPVPAALIWRPRGRFTATEVALVWSRPSDRAELEKIFAGPNQLKTSEVCGQLVLSSSAELTKLVERACKKEIPAWTHADPGMTAGLAAPTSAALLIDFGKLLRGVLADAYTAQHEKKPDPKSKKPAEPVTFPPEIEDALRTLETLPSFGFSGVIEGGRWVAKGFRS
ncbi:MAG: hypothetical protein HY791_22310 [Deltaproteobacteria bacterium]|nr:hypothetical protein [Deltaproteobacteria bacterium]